MKKVNVVVVFDNDNLQVLSLTVNHRGNYISMIRPDSKLQLERGTSFQDVYQKILALLKANHMYAGYHEIAGARYYDIMWIDSRTHHIDQYNYLGGGNK